MASKFQKRKYRKVHTRKGRKGKQSKRRRHMRPTTSHEKTIVADRTFDVLKYVSLTQSTINNVTDNYNSDGYGLIGVAPNQGPVMGVTADMFVFAPTYSISPAGATGLPVAFRILPGNSLQLQAQNTNSGTQYFSDMFHQEMPTGTDAWANFYNSAYVHGSAVEVTVVNSPNPGQLVVLPITLTPAAGSSRGQGQYEVTYNGSSFTAAPNLLNLITFKVLPDDQPYAKIKLVARSGGIDKVVIRHRMTTRKLYNTKNLTDDSDNAFQMTKTISPNQGFDPYINQWGWFIAFIPVGAPIGYAAGNTVSVQVKISYFCELTDRVEVPYVGYDVGF